MRDNLHRGITDERVAHVLENWVIRGICNDSGRRQSQAYWGFVPGLGQMVKVAVSMDDEVIVTAYLDRTATIHWNKGNRGYFANRCKGLEERDANSL